MRSRGYVLRWSPAAIRAARAVFGGGSVRGRLALVVGVAAVAMLAWTAGAYAAGSGLVTVSTAVGSATVFDKPSGVCADLAGNLYFLDSYNSVIRKVTTTGSVAILAGSEGSTGTADGPAATARFCFPSGICYDTADGYLYVADTNACTIRRVDSVTGQVTTIAGGALASGSSDGSGAAAHFSYPSAICYDSGDGRLYVTDSGNDTIRRVTTGGAVTTFAGAAGIMGYADGTGAAARFAYPAGLCYDSTDGCLYVTDTYNHTVRKITAGAAVTTLAGSAGSSGRADGSGAAARFFEPRGICYVPATSSLYVSDSYNQTIRQINGTTVTTLAGTPEAIGSADGLAAVARFSYPQGICYDVADGALYVADTSNDSIRRVTTSGYVSLVAGVPASLDKAAATCTDDAGNLYVADSGNGVIRKVDPSGGMSVLAGYVGHYGVTDGTGSSATFVNPDAICYDQANGNLYVADYGAGTIRRVTAAGVVTTVAGLAYTWGTADGSGSAARFGASSAICYDSADDCLFVVDSASHTIRKVTTAGVVTTIAGLASTSGAADGTGSEARFSFPECICYDTADGNLYVTDTSNRTIRKVTPAGVVTTLAGLPGAMGTLDGPGGAARFILPWGICYDAADGSLYVTDMLADTVRRITMGATPIVSTVAGTAYSQGSANGPGSRARFADPTGICYSSADGALYLAEYLSDTVRQLTVDYAAPVTTATGLAANSYSAWQRAGQVSLSRNLAGSTRYSVDGGGVQTYAGPFSVSGSGSHAVLYYSIGPSGATEAAHLGYVNIDTGKPTVQALAAVKVKKGKMATMRFSVTDLTPSATVTIKIYKGTKLKKTLAVGVKATNSTQSYKWSCKLAKGSYTWKVYATDAAGNAQTKVGSKTLVVK